MSLSFSVDGAREASRKLTLGCFPSSPSLGCTLHFLYLFFFFSVIHSYKELIRAEGQKLFFFVVCLPRATEVLRKAEHQENSP